MNTPSDRLVNAAVHEAFGCDGDGSEMWQELFECSPIALSYVDVNGNQIAINQAFAELVGYESTELASIRVADLTRPEDQEWTRGYLARLVSGEIDHFHTDKVFVRKDGSHVTVTGRIRSVRTAVGRCLGLLGAFHQAEQRGYVEDQRLRRLLSFSDATVTVVDVNGSVLETTGRYQDVLGYPPEFWENRTVFDLLAPGQELIATTFRDEVLANPGERRSAEFRLVSARGEQHAIRLHALNLLDNAEVNGIILTTINITEERQIFEGLHERTATAEAVVNAQTMLLATVSHELRNPLHALQGVAELLVTESLQPRALALASELLAQLTGLTDLTQDLLDTAEASAGTVRVRPDRVALHPLVREVARYGDAMVTNVGSQARIECIIEPGVPELVVSDAVRLRQILRNLVGNAIKFTANGAIELRVSTRANGVVRFTVTDFGSGIPYGDLERIREPFVTGVMAGSKGGAGLGLSIVSRTVAALHGTLHVASTLGVGSVFAVDIPLEPVSSGGGPNAAAVSERGTGTEFDPAGAVVLVVEDNAVNQQLARGQLSRLGMEAHIVGSGEEAIELLMSPDCPRFDVVLMDHGLPGMNGVETMHAIRSLGGERAALPVICVTASGAVTDQHRFMAEGMDGFVSKPASLASIRAGIAAVLLARTEVSSEVSAEVSAEVEPVGRRTSRILIDDTLAALCEDFGDVALIRELAVTFIGEMPSRVSAIVGNDRHGGSSHGGSSQAAHTLKGAAWLLGANDIGALCNDIENGAIVDVDRLAVLAADAVSNLQGWLDGTP